MWTDVVRRVAKGSLRAAERDLARAGVAVGLCLIGAGFMAFGLFLALAAWLGAVPGALITGALFLLASAAVMPLRGGASKPPRSGDPASRSSPEEIPVVMAAGFVDGFLRSRDR